MHSMIHDSDYMDMEVGMAYRFLNNRSVLTEMHTHNYYEYFLITSGEIYHIVNGKTTRGARYLSGRMTVINTGLRRARNAR